jgi:hypothetical protein
MGAHSYLLTGVATNLWLLLVAFFWLLASKFVAILFQVLEKPVILIDFVATSHKICGEEGFLILWLHIVLTDDVHLQLQNWVLPGCSRQ